MAFVKIEDQFGEAELVIFPGVYLTVADQIVRDNVVLVKGKLSDPSRNQGTSKDLKIIVDSLNQIDIDEATKYQPKKPRASKTAALLIPGAKNAAKTPVKRLFIRLASTDDQSLLTTLKQTIDANNGDTDVVLVLGQTDSKQIIKLPVKIEASDQNIFKLQELVGSDNIKLH